MFEAGKYFQPSDIVPGLKQILEISNRDNMVTRTSFVEASNMICKTSTPITEVDSMKSNNLNDQVDNSSLWVVRKHGDRIFLRDSDRKP